MDHLGGLSQALTERWANATPRHREVSPKVSRGVDHWHLLALLPVLGKPQISPRIGARGHSVALGKRNSGPHAVTEAK
eukprot:778708-Alexandrium_andersonii.AAC.1